MPKSKHLFFPNFDLFQQITGRPQGTGIIKYAAKHADNSPVLDVDDKTLRKIIKGDKVSKRSESKLETFISKLTGIQSPSERLKPDRDMLINQAIWHAHFEAVSVKEADVQATFLSVGRKLLDCEVELALQLRQAPKLSLENLWQVFDSDYGQFLLRDIEVPTREELGILEDRSAPDVVQREVQLREVMIHGMISLQMCLLAACEIDLQRSVMLDEPREPWFARYLPQFREDKSVVHPLRLLFERWKELYDINSWEQLAESMPTLFGTSTEHRARKLYAWMEGSYAPAEDIQGAVDWIRALQNDNVDDRYLDGYIRIYSLIFASNFQRILQVMSDYGGLKKDTLITAFTTYEHHFQSILDGNLPTVDSGPSE